MDRWFLLLAIGAGGCVDPGGKADHGGTGDTSATTPQAQTTPTQVAGQVECKPPTETPDPGALGFGDCVTDSLTCGATVNGTIAGGSTVFSNQLGAAFEQCSGHGPGADLDGPERVYRLDIPEGDTYVSAHLASCETAQLLWYQAPDVCPTGHVQCSYVHVDGALDQGEDILLSNAGIIWFVVEGIGGATGNYALTVDCGAAR